jgi:hypothetical protein
MPEKLMPYDLDQLIADCRSGLTSDPGPKGREHKGREQVQVKTGEVHQTPPQQAT